MTASMRGMQRYVRDLKTCKGEREGRSEACEGEGEGEGRSEAEKMVAVIVVVISMMRMQGM